MISATQFWLTLTSSVDRAWSFHSGMNRSFSSSSTQSLSRSNSHQHSWIPDKIGWLRWHQVYFSRYQALTPMNIPQLVIERHMSRIFNRFHSWMLIAWSQWSSTRKRTIIASHIVLFLLCEYLISTLDVLMQLLIPLNPETTVIFIDQILQRISLDNLSLSLSQQPSQLHIIHPPYRTRNQRWNNMLHLTTNRQSNQHLINHLLTMRFRW